MVNAALHHGCSTTPSAGWRASLTLEFERRGARTVLASRRHAGPLVVQKPLYPEGDEVCHAIVVHPPAGIAGGDELELTVHGEAKSRVLLTTPGAGKWYRSAGPPARQHVVFAIDDGASAEWMPQENIIFDGAIADISTEVRLSGDADFIGWEVFCLGRTGSGENFFQGACSARLLIQREGNPVWLERARLKGGGGELRAPAVLAGHPVAGTFIAASLRLDEEMLAAGREIKTVSGQTAVTLLPGVLVGRYLGAHTEAAKDYFAQLWRVVRPALLGREAREPRIWRT